jgi:hypothetical protein
MQSIESRCEALLLETQSLIGKLRQKGTPKGDLAMKSQLLVSISESIDRELWENAKNEFERDNPGFTVNRKQVVYLG